jgi:hypothetical protein
MTRVLWFAERPRVLAAGQDIGVFPESPAELACLQSAPEPARTALIQSTAQAQTAKRLGKGIFNLRNAEAPEKAGLGPRIDG